MYFFEKLKKIYLRGDLRSEAAVWDDLSAVSLRCCFDENGIFLWNQTVCGKDGQSKSPLFGCQERIDGLENPVSFHSGIIRFLMEICFAVAPGTWDSSYARRMGSMAVIRRFEKSQTSCFKKNIWSNLRHILSAFRLLMEVALCVLLL